MTFSFGAVPAIVFLFGRAVWCQTPTAPGLAAAQALVDDGRIREAEATARSYAAVNPQSADGHFLLGYILFRETNPKASLAEYAEGAKHGVPGPLDLAVEGCDYFLMEDYAAAHEYLSKSIAFDLRDALPRYYLGRTDYNQKHFDQAVRDFKDCLDLDPGNVKAADYLGLSFQELGRTEEAEAAFRKAIAIGTSRDAEPRLNLGTLLAENNRPAEALPFLTQAVDADPNNFQAQREAGKAFLLLRCFTEARDALEKAAALAPQNAPVHFLLAQAYRGLGLAARAQGENERYAALTAQHSSPETPLTEARSLVNAGKIEAAEATVRRYLSTSQTSAEAHYLLGYILFKEQRPKDSLAEYTGGAKYKQPSAADLEAVAGDYVLLKDYPDADKWFTKAVEWNPKDELGWYYLGRTKYNENRFEEAIVAFQECLKLKPQDVKAEDNLGLSYEGLNRMEEAQAAYRTAIQWEKDAEKDSPVKDAGPFLNLGTLLTDSGSGDEALADLKQAAAIADGDYRVHRQLGKLYSRLNRMENARTEMERAVTLAPDSAPLHFMLAQVYRKMGMAQKAQLESNRYTALTGANSQ
jgi:tetratricopeptide (TPR) repeat protein